MNRTISQYLNRSALREFARNLWHKMPAEQRKTLQSGASGIFVRNVRQFLGNSVSIPNYGVLTVVIPVYNVQEYLEECVLSVVGQTYRRLQILLIDDGSTDDSLRIARRLALADRRIRVITKQNNGLGAARNTGIAAAMGRYIAFVDSDDIVPKRAYESMIRTLNETGSDFVVGSIHRLKEKKRSVPKWAQEVHAEDRLRVTLQEFPEILHNVFAWNKVFRKEFWDKTLHAFPEGVLYEDQEVTAKAYAEAKSFDVLKTIVYDWRIRSDRSSITQQKDNIRDLSDRLLVTERLNNYLISTADSETYKFWLVKVLGTDLAQYYVQVPRVGEEYWSVLQASVSSLLRSVDTDVLAQISVHERLLLECIRNNNRTDFEAIIYYNAENGRSYPIELEESNLRAQPGYLQLLTNTVRRTDIAVSETDLQVKGEISRVSLAADNTIEVLGNAYIPGIDTHELGIKPNFSLINVLTGASRPLSYSLYRDDYIDLNSNDAWTSYAESAFRIKFNPGIMQLEGEAAPKGTEWRLSVTFDVGGTTVVGKLATRKATGAAAVFPVLAADSDNGRWVCRHSQAFGLSFVRETYRRYLCNLSIKNREISFDVKTSETDDFVSVLVECKKFRLSATGTEGPPATVGIRRFTVSLPDLPWAANDFAEVTWSIKVMTAHGVGHDLAWLDAFDRQSESTTLFELLRLQISGFGYAQLSDRKSGVRAEQWSVDSESETLSLVVGFVNKIALQDIPEMIFANGRSKIKASEQSWVEEGTRAKYVFPLTGSRWNMYTAAVESGMYSLRCIVTDSKGRITDHWTEVALGAQSSLPEYHSTPSVNITLARTAQAAAMSLRVGPPLRLSERGKLMQGRLQRNIPDWLAAPVYRGAVLFESFGGKTIGDSSLAIFNEMLRTNDLRPKYWSVHDHSVVVPSGATPLVMYSEEWYRVLHTAEYVVNNNNFPFFYQKHNEQKYIQVWHGTPLKKIGNDISASTLSLPYIKLMKKEARSWDYLLAQNPFAREVLPRAFGYEGDVLEVGYPRNDSLVGLSATQRGLEIQGIFGIPSGKKIILYAPTWRDNIRADNNSYGFINFLNVKEAIDHLGEDYVFLIRGHHNVAGQRYFRSESNVIDVTSYPNINDLMLMADILVTDYSSVMFDFAVSRKPMYFLTPDLAAYRDSVRGFYFDFEAEAPGPIVSTTAELVHQICNSENNIKYAATYAEFTRRYAPRDDGSASSRVYDHVWNN